MTMRQPAGNSKRRSAESAEWVCQIQQYRCWILLIHEKRNQPIK